MSSESPPAKRQRTDEDEPITRSDIWYEDGSVVLQARNTQFRVHWGVLAQHSSFFRDMQKLPQPPDQPNADGCPIVELQDDVADVEHLLRALYSSKFLFQPALSLAVIGALIRLGSKYEFQDILDFTVERLTFENPTTLEAYDGRIPYTLTRIEQYPGILFDIATLARENNIMSVLPCAFYRLLVTYTPMQLFDGIPRTDGTLASLTQVDLRRCILAREQLINAQYQPGYTWGGFDHGILLTHRNAPILESVPKGGMTNSPTSPRLQRAIDLIVAGRKKIWDELPGFFDLPPWSELKNDL
ncbi:hypothetical protein B0H13DRAFT_2262236 [Mycena leptocephala]|nr:hypothetical protein B0H13DRAFT_2262236 [Mycena leptocephala]